LKKHAYSFQDLSNEYLKEFELVFTVPRFFTTGSPYRIFLWKNHGDKNLVILFLLFH
jgi:hypothetical protein